MNSNMLLWTLLFLAPASLLLVVVVCVMLLETLKCSKQRSAQDARIIDLLAKLDASQSDNSRNLREITEKCTAAIVQVGVLVNNLHKYFERTALTDRLPAMPMDGEE